MATAIAEKAFTSGLPELLTQLFGSKTTTSGGGSNDTITSKTSADTGALTDAMKNTGPMTSDMFTKMLEGIFSQAATQVPTLTAALANATGSRSSNNSPLALALNEQNNQAAKQLVPMLLDYNTKQAGLAVQGGAALANSSKTVTENRTTSPQEKTTTTGAGGNPLLTALLGTAVNKLDKKGALNWLTSGADAVTSNLNAPQLGSNFGDFTPNTTNFGTGSSSFFESPVDLSGAGSFGGAAPLDFSSLASGLDFSAVSNLFSGDAGADSALSGFGDFSGFSELSEAAPIWDDAIDFGSFFADGGLLTQLQHHLRQAGPITPSAQLMADGGSPQPKMRQELRPSYAPAINQTVFGYADGGRLPMAMPEGYDTYGNPLAGANYFPGDVFGPADITTRAPGYADGGSVIRNRNNMGGPISRDGMLALRGPVEQDGFVSDNTGASGQGISNTQIQEMLPALLRRNSGNAPTQGGMEGGDATTTPAVPGQLGGVGSKALSSIASMGLGALTHSSLLGKVLSMALMSHLSNQAQAQSNASLSLSNPEGSTVTTSSSGAQSTGMAATDALGNPTNANMSVAPPGMVGTDLSNAALGGVPSGTGEPGGIGDIGVSVGETTGTGEPGGVGDGGASGDGSGDGFSDGGLLKGPGTGTSDSIKTKIKEPGGAAIGLSTNEFIIPADVVAVPGMKDHFQKLIDAYHKPVRR